MVIVIRQFILLLVARCVYAIAGLFSYFYTGKCGGLLLCFSPGLGGVFGVVAFYLQHVNAILIDALEDPCRIYGFRSFAWFSTDDAANFVSLALDRFCIVASFLSRCYTCMYEEA